MTEINRRSFTKAAAWSVPVIAAAVAVPLAAASTTPHEGCLVLTNKTAGIGGKPNTIFINYKVKHTEGPNATGAMTVLVTATRDGVQVFSDQRDWASLAGWGVTEYVAIEIPGIAKGLPVTIDVVVTHEGAYQDGFTQQVQTPGWWA